AHQKHQDEVPQSAATKDEQGDEGQERGGARVDGAGQRLIKTAVQQVEEGFAFADPQVFPHPVKDDDGGVERVPDDCEDGRDEGAVDLYPQRSEEHTSELQSRENLV